MIMMMIMMMIMLLLIVMMINNETVSSQTNWNTTHFHEQNCHDRGMKNMFKKHSTQYLAMSPNQP